MCYVQEIEGSNLRLVENKLKREDDLQCQFVELILYSVSMRVSGSFEQGITLITLVFKNI